MGYGNTGPLCLMPKLNWAFATDMAHMGDESSPVLAAKANNNNPSKHPPPKEEAVVWGAPSLAKGKRKSTEERKTTKKVKTENDGF
ncbi:hypothetical protein L1987_70679 [Smallanthus sonchifolius]|uniref:Uncharacterized protein n=1 Tax=Smallanthus sonchifolius TaxID=185202 RepID=A0ACB9AQC6_9ASTR|nr:hypothetical protein L1987_70679 [Smallanthus sonchifolius]